jgi:hypothetical protein
MCLACAALAAPEVAVIVGGYAAMRFGRPVARLRDALGRVPDADRAPTSVDGLAEDASGTRPPALSARD